MFSRASRLFAPAGRQFTRQQQRFMGASAALSAGAFAYSQQKNAKTEGSEMLAAAAAGGFLIGTAVEWYLKQQEINKVTEKYETYWPRKIMILFGAPGAGKGTQGPKIYDEIGIPQLSTGDMLRALLSQDSELSRQVKAIMAAGELVKDEIVISIIKERIKDPDCASGFILDGFPRNLDQAKALDAMLTETGECVSLCLSFDVPDSILEERICGRWIHKASGRSYHVKFAPPKSMKLDANGNPVPETMKDDATGQPLMQRPDDTAQALTKRLQEYHGKTVPILDHYGPKGIVKRVDANQQMNTVWAAVKASLTVG